MANGIFSKVIIGTPQGQGNAIDGYVSAASTVVSTPQVLDNLKGISVHVVFSSASSLAGSLSFQFSNLALSNMTQLVPTVQPGYKLTPPAQNLSENMAWAKFSSYPDVSIVSFSGSQSLIYEVSPLYSRFFQLVWTPSGGTGNILVVLNAKNES